MLPKQQHHYNTDSPFYNKPLSRQKTITQTLKYLTYLKKNITPFPPQHNTQLIFLIDYFHTNDRLITNFYHNPYFQTDPAKFRLNFYQIYEKLDMEQFVKFDWNHLCYLSFYYCGWFKYDDWKALVKNAGMFQNLRFLYLNRNIVTVVREGDIQKFNALEYVDLCGNPLRNDSKEILRQCTRKNNKIAINFSR